MLDEETDCYSCGENRAVILCRGCGIPLCGVCVRLEDFGFGCDGGMVVAFCTDCFADPDVNSVLKQVD